VAAAHRTTLSPTPQPDPGVRRGGLLLPPGRPVARSHGMYSIFYIIGVIVVVLAILSLIGLA
jgi:uncharacterized membrane protein YkgB